MVDAVRQERPAKRSHSPQRFNRATFCLDANETTHLVVEECA